MLGSRPGAHGGTHVDLMPETNASLELWLVDFDNCAEALEEVERLQPRLAQDDLDRASSISDLRERRFRICAYVALRVLLERMAGPSVRAVPFTRAPGRKPQIESCPADFSLSHIDRFALIGVSTAPPLGVDFEGPRSVQMVANRTPEILALAAGFSEEPLPSETTDRAFLQAWSRLEAFSKARGCGLARTLADLGARGSPLHRPSLPELRANAQRLAIEAGLTTWDVELPAGLVGAVAAARGRGPVQARQFPADANAIERLTP